MKDFLQYTGAVALVVDGVYVLGTMNDALHGIPLPQNFAENVVAIGKVGLSLMAVGYLGEIGSGLSSVRKSVDDLTKELKKARDKPENKP